MLRILLLVVWMVGLGTRSRRCRCTGFSGLAILLDLVETTGIWPQGLLDVFFAMIPKADGGSTPLGQRPLSVLPVVYRLWASLRLGHLRESVEGWLPESVFSLGNGLSSVEAWFSTALDIEEVLSGTGGDQLHVMVADVIGSFDTVVRSILDCALGRLGLPDFCFVRSIFLFIVRFVSGSSLLVVLVNRGVGMVVFPRAVLSVWFSLWFFTSLGVVIWMLCLMLKPQLFADDLKCSAERPRALFESARFTAQYVRSVGQDVSPGKCVLLSTSKSVRRGHEACGDMLLVMVVFGRFSWMSGIWVGILISLLGLGLVLFPRGLVKATVWGCFSWCFTFRVFRLSWVWFVVSICLLASMLQRHLMSLPRLLVLLGLLLFCGLVQ